MADDDLVLEEAKEQMQKSLESLQAEFAKIRTGRATPALLEGVMVDYYGSSTALKALATISAPEARLLVVQPFDPSAMGEIERGILKAGLGLSPVNDGKILRVPVPELTEDRRRDLVKAVKKIGETYKVGVRGARRDAIALLKDLQKAGDLPEDDSKKAQAKAQESHDAYIAQIDKALETKEEEILRI